MSTITWLHIADLQFGTSQTEASKALLEEFLQDVENCTIQYSINLDFIAITGDIALSGKPEEYGVAQAFLDRLLNVTGLNKDRLFLVPGNHDVDEKQVTGGAQTIAKALMDQASVNAVLENPHDRHLMLARFNGYADFVNSYLGEHLTFSDDRYFYVQTLELDERQVAILGLNTALLSEPHQGDTKDLVIGEYQVRATLQKAADADLKIALLHHPLDQLRDFDRDDVEATLCRDCQFVLHGHVHRTTLRNLSDPDTEAMLIAAGVCHAESRYPGSYNYVQLDLSEGRGKIFLRRFSERRPGFWASDTLSYRNAPNGHYEFKFALKKSATKPRMLQPGEEIDNGHYRILRSIHEGSSAVIWLAEQEQPHLPKVVIKEPRPQKTHRQELEQRFKQEMILKPYFQHLPHVVRVHELVHRASGPPLLVSSYADGGSLAEAIASKPDGLPVEQALSITRDILEALAGVHRLRVTPIIHRDIKPSNILLDSQQGALLSDFGLAQLTDNRMDARLPSKSHPGTSLYKAPEQERDTTTIQLTPAADLYALGCVLFEMLTGKRYKLVVPGTKAGDIRSNLPAWLDEVLAKALAEEPSNRYQTADEMARALEPPFTWPVGHILEGKYEILDGITGTARCEIYKTRDLRHPQEIVVVKRLKPDPLLDRVRLVTKDEHGRFDREIAILKQVRHPCVLQLRDDGGRFEDGNRYFVTEFADGGSLSDYLKTKPDNTLEPDESVRIALAICQAIDAIHQLSIVHRDIKPSNIFLFSKEDGYVVKLGDFGTARVPKAWRVDSIETQTGIFVGSYLYSAPEQFLTVLDDPRSDLYAWAAVWFEMLTGESLAHNLIGASAEVSFLALLEYYSKSPAEELPISFFKDKNIPQEFGHILQKALRKDPDRRYQSATELQKDLSRAQAAIASWTSKSVGTFPGPTKIPLALKAFIGSRLGQLGLVGRIVLSLLIVIAPMALCAYVGWIVWTGTPQTSTATAMTPPSATTAPLVTVSPPNPLPMQTITPTDTTTVPANPTLERKPFITDESLEMISKAVASVKTTRTALAITLTQTPPEIVSPTRTGSQTPESRSAYPAPTLLEPTYGESLLERRTFSWEWDGPTLREDHYFDLRIWSEQEEQAGELKRGAADLTMDTEVEVTLRHVPAIQEFGAGDYYWTVVVVESGPNGSTKVVGEWGEKRRFTYRDSSIPNATQTPKPVLTTPPSQPTTPPPQPTTPIPNQSPIAKFSYECSGMKCEFDASNSSDPDGNITGYSWNFGDGQGGDGKKTSHKFRGSGTYTVSLTVTDDDGATDRQSKRVSVP